MMVDGKRRLRNADRNGLEQCPKVTIRRIQGQIFFGSIEELDRDFASLSRSSPGQNIIVLILRGVETVDLAGADFLNQHIRRARKAGGDFFLVAGYPGLTSALRRYGTLALLGEDHLLTSKGEAISRAAELVPGASCATCTKRVFADVLRSRVPTAPSENRRFCRSGCWYREPVFHFVGQFDQGLSDVFPEFFGKDTHGSGCSDTQADAGILQLDGRGYGTDPDFQFLHTFAIPTPPNFLKFVRQVLSISLRMFGILSKLAVNDFFLEGFATEGSNDLGTRTSVHWP